MHKKGRRDSIDRNVKSMIDVNNMINEWSVSEDRTIYRE